MPASEFPVDVVRFEASASRPVVISRAKRSETLKAMPASLRSRAEAAFERSARRQPRLRWGHGRHLDFETGPAVMGILNVTPDSFSDGGLHFERGRAVDRALEMFSEGAAIVDVGGESTRPANYGEAAPLPPEEEIARVVPVIEAIRAKTDAPLSIDTRKAAVAKAALEAGADLVNDVSAGRFDADMLGTIAAGGAGAILMHMKGTDPRTMQDDLRYGHLVGEIASFLADAARRAADGGHPARTRSPWTRASDSARVPGTTSSCSATSRRSARWASRSLRARPARDSSGASRAFRKTPRPPRGCRARSRLSAPRRRAEPRSSACTTSRIRFAYLRMTGAIARAATTPGSPSPAPTTSGSPSPAGSPAGSAAL